MNPSSFPPQPPPSPRQNSFLGLLGIFLVSLGCLLLVCVLGSSYLLLRFLWDSDFFSPAATPQISQQISTPTHSPTIATTIDLTSALATLKTLSQTELPRNNAIDLARRLQGKTNIPETLPGPAPIFNLGDEQSFWIVNGDTDQHNKIQAKLAYTTDHLYFWIQTGVKYNATDLKNLCETFENKIYPTDRKFFGSEWTPGIDNDVHLYVVLTQGLGSRVAGYFSSADSVPPAAFPFSNGHEMFVMSTGTTADLKDPYNYTVLAHEFQHMIHWYRDRNEESWMNEGFSEMAAFLNGYDLGRKDVLFATKPDMQLNDWPNDKTQTLAHYGSSFLFLNYFLDRFGSEITQALVADTKNGFDSVDDVLTRSNARDPATQKTVTADELFADWTLTNYLKDKTVGDGRYVYNNYPASPTVKHTEELRTCPVDNQTRTVNQYGADYIRIACRGQYTLSFQGSSAVNLLPVDPHGGLYAFWSNKGDDSDMTLSRAFDFTNLKNTVTLSYWTWYDLEEHYDFVHLVASTDGGSTWEILNTPSGTADNTSGANYGWGYNNKSNTWKQESVDLSKFAGKKVILRFEYITDAAVNGEGFLLDDIEISQLGYKTNFEQDAGGWEPAGFVRVQNRLPQTFRVALIKHGSTRSVQYLTLNADGSLQLPLNLTSDVVLVVSGTTRYTRTPAVYSFSIQR